MGKQVFDGFCYRPYDEDIDGWRDDQPNSYDYQSVKMASDILEMFQAICTLKRDLWEAKKRLSMYEGKL